MNWMDLAKHSITLGSTIFDIGSDIANSLNFLGVFNNDTYINITASSINNVTSPTTNTSKTPICAPNEIIRCETTDQRYDFIWGILSLVIVFLPGAFLGVSEVLKSISDKKWRRVFLVLVAGIPLLSVAVPFWLMYIQLLAIIKTCRKKEVSQSEKLLIIQSAGFESSIESTLQLLLQLFTLLNGYPGTLIQAVTIAASFFQIARCSIRNDIETKIFMIGGKELPFKESVKETIYRLPLYASTIIFRIGSLCLVIAYLRYFSLIPIATLVVIQTIITWKRCSKLKLHKTFQLVVSNIGSVNAYSRFQTDTTVAEDEKDVVKFIKDSAIATFICHSTMLISIVIVGLASPNIIEHWSLDPCVFPLKPSMQTFLWVFGSVCFMGLYSLTAIIYRAPVMAKVEINTMECKHEEDQIEAVLLKEQGSGVTDKLDKVVQTDRDESK